MIVVEGVSCNCYVGAVLPSVPDWLRTIMASGGVMQVMDAASGVQLRVI